MKDQDKAPERELNETETGNLSDKELKILVIRMLNDLRRIDELSENLIKR